ncbi:MAG: 3-methyl-2-oxobutanoate hydroxymethyltransferase [Mariprofundaceae bacterium]|nr:3-methyl-2-oxobutanoate hydroxymethyltransferase [Mariprofundaceae bacterium]
MQNKQIKQYRQAALPTKQAEHPQVWLTAYDAHTAMIAEAAGVDVILVGDSLGMVSLGFNSTIPVTLEHMVHHASAVVRGRQHAWVVCDLPFGSYQQSAEQAFASSSHVLQMTGCDAVKIEGGQHMAKTIRFLSERGVAVVAHIGLTPQSVKTMGGFKKQGNNQAAAEQVFHDAVAVAEAGAVAVVLECIPDVLANDITQQLDIPTVGIGAGQGCDAQVLVWHDVLGLNETNPPFAPAYAHLRQDMVRAIETWADDVRQRSVACK